MKKINKHIEIVRSSTKGLSSMSQASADSILVVLDKYFSKAGVSIVNNLADLDALIASQPDLVFLGMEFIPADPAIGLADTNKIWLSEALEDNEILYTGSGRSAQELGRNKHLAKQRAMDANLQTSAFRVIEQNQSIYEKDLPLDFPLFIKPTNRGGGLGIDSNSVVHSFEQLLSKVNSITSKLKTDALVEEYLAGREFSVAILRGEYSYDLLAMPLELIAPPDSKGSRLLSGSVKSANSEQALAVIDSVVKTKVTELALAVFDALGARDYGRIDVRLDAAGTPHFLEANLIPSLISGYGSFPKACVLNIGLNYEAMIIRIVNLALARKVNTIVNDPEYLTKTVPSRILFEPF